MNALVHVSNMLAANELSFNNFFYGLRPCALSHATTFR